VLGGCAVGNLLMLSNAGFKLLLCWLNHIIIGSDDVFKKRTKTFAHTLVFLKNR